MESGPRLASFIYFSASTTEKKKEGGCEQKKSTSRLPRTPPRYGACKSNKRRQQREERHVVVENDLVQYCRTRDWTAVIHRCRSNPEEAIPKQIAETESLNGCYANAAKRGVQGKFFDYEEAETVYYETPLGIACTSTELDSRTLQEVIVALVLACPGQVRASQLIPGHTPLRDALLNSRCNCFILGALLDAEVLCAEKNGADNSCLGKPDLNGQCPVDHIMAGLKLGSSTLGLDLFRCYLEHIIFSMTELRGKAVDNHNILIKLLGATNAVPIELSRNCTQLQRLLISVELLLEKDPSALTVKSKLTGCSVIHVALRNYGNYIPLLDTLVAKPGAIGLMTHRNNFGDLPLHVASSVGVPFEVLETIVKHTAASAPRDAMLQFERHPLIWSINRAGYTAVDLEWVRHIESGQGLDSVRAFYPLEPSGITRHCMKQDEYYKTLLEEAVDRITCQESSSYEFQAKNIMGTLLDRISLLVAASARSPLAQNFSLSLHDVCKLSSRGTPTLPYPLVRLFFLLLKKRFLSEDDQGNIPLHYLLHDSRKEDAAESDDTKDWAEHVLKYIELEPRAIFSATREGRLPLHILLDHCSRLDMLQRMLVCFPDSVDYKDPTTGFAPFLLAAQNKSACVDSVYFLLRQSPSRCHDRLSTKS